MREPTYYRASGRAYMVLSCPEDADLKSYQYHMLALNRIDGLLPCSLREIDGDTFLYFDITGRQSVRSLFETRPMSGDIYARLIASLQQAAETLTQYLLDTDRLALCGEMVFYDFSEERFFFTYLPEGETPKDLFGFVAEHIDRSDKDAAASAYRFCSLSEETETGFWSALFKERKEGGSEERVLTDIPGEKAATESEETVINSPPEPEAEEKKAGPGTAKIRRKDGSISRRSRRSLLKKVIAVLLPVLLFLLAAGLLYLQYYLLLTDSVRSLYRVGAAVSAAGAVFFIADAILTYRGNSPGKGRRAERTAPEVFGSAEFFSESRENGAGSIPDPEETSGTVFLKRDDPGKLYGTGEARGCTIGLDKLPVTVGKAADHVDLVLGDPSVSRVHARICRNARGKIEIVDLGSTNGTSVNGIEAGIQEGKELERGDEVRIGALTFVYR